MDYLQYMFCAGIWREKLWGKVWWNFSFLKFHIIELLSFSNYLAVWLDSGSFTTEPTTTALNAAVEAVCEISDGQAKSGEGLQESSYSFGIPEAIVTPHLRSAPLQGLKYSSCSYMATLSPVWCSTLFQIQRTVCYRFMFFIFLELFIA